MNGVVIDLHELAKKIGAYEIQIFENGVWSRYKYGDMNSGTYIGRDGAETDFKHIKSNPKNAGKELRIAETTL